MSALDDVMLAAGPSLLWKLDEVTGSVAADASGNGNSGTIYASPTLGQDGPAACTADDLAMFIDGAGTGATAQYVHRSTSPYAGVGDVSFEGWYWPAADAWTRAARPFANLMQQRRNPRSDVGLMRVEATSPLWAGSGSSTVGLRLASAVVISAPLTRLLDRTECWNHVAVTRESNLWTLYVNAAAVGSAINAISVTVENLSMGGDQPDINPLGSSAAEQELFRGRIAKLAVYPGVVLSAADIAARWALGCTVCRDGFQIGKVGIGPGTGVR